MVRYFHRSIVLILVLLLVSCISFAEEAPSLTKPSYPAPRLGSTPVEKQIELALELYEQMSAASPWDLETFKTNHRRVIQDCPDTPWAIESSWRLSNLIITADPSPDLNEVIRLMEHVLNDYPVNPWRERFENRMITTLQDIGDHQKLLDVCSAQLKTVDPASENYLSLCLTAGKAAEALGEKETASAYFDDVIHRDAGRNTIFARIAQSRRNR